jgi:hypothetical protein
MTAATAEGSDPGARKKAAEQPLTSERSVPFAPSHAFRPMLTNSVHVMKFVKTAGAAFVGRQPVRRQEIPCSADQNPCSDSSVILPNSLNIGLFPALFCEVRQQKPRNSLLVPC